MKLPEIVDMVVTKEHQQEWSKKFFDKKTESRVSINKELPEELHKQVIKKLKKKKSLWLDSNNNILMYSTLIEAKSVISERFIKTLKAKIYEIMTAKDSKLYIAYLNKALDEYNNSYHW